MLLSSVKSDGLLENVNSSLSDSGAIYVWLINHLSSETGNVINNNVIQNFGANSQDVGIYP
jgi:hypothetical protein